MSPIERQEFLESLGAQGPVSALQVQLSEPIEVVPRATDAEPISSIEENIQTEQASDSLADNPVPEEIGQQLEQFGYDLFAGTPTIFAPATDIPVPASYIMGPGDNVIIQLYG